MEAQVNGTVMPVLEMVLNPGETLVAEASEALGQRGCVVELEVMIYDLEPGPGPGGTPGARGVVQESVQCEITTVPGIKNKLFGGDGLFLAKLTGPGRVWLQTLPLATLAHALSPYMVEGETASGGSAGAVAGGAGRPPRRRLGAPADRALPPPARGLFHLAPVLAFQLGLTLLELPLAASQPQLELGQAVREVHAKGDEREPTLLRLAD